MTEPLGLFGGTFDPVHFGHLRLAEEAIGNLGLGGVRWIPAGQPPHRGAPQVTGQQRLEMVLRSTAGNARFSVDASEVEAAAPSYTVHTLERLRDEIGLDRPLVLLVGADAFAGLPTWHRWRDLFGLAHIAVAQRPGFPAAAGSLHQVDPELTDPYNQGNPNFRPRSTSPALFLPTAVPPNDGFFQIAQFIGALSSDPAADWTAGWTSFPQK